MVRDPQVFYRSCKKLIVVFDDVHQLRDPARVLKIGADGFPKLKILATGSSTLAASKKFRDTLAGRKRLVHLTPVTWDELPAFGATLPQRLFHGGLPPALLAESKKPALYREWMDSFFARDIQRLFGFLDMNRFNALLEYLLRQSGGQFEVTKTATALGTTRPTVESHVRALEITHAVTLVRPFHGGGQHELVKQPKVYAFGTPSMTPSPTIRVFVSSTFSDLKAERDALQWSTDSRSRGAADGSAPLSRPAWRQSSLKMSF